MSDALIQITNIKKHFYITEGFLFNKRKIAMKAVDDVSLTVQKGEIVGIVGESGSGKTTLARIILGLIKQTDGTVTINGTDMNRIGRSALKKMRRDIAVVFQDPASNLNPRITVEESIMRPMRIYGVPLKEAKTRAREVMEKVKLDACYLGSYPHQLSGGQLQRIAVARALAVRPKIMILDEPTSALDISVQAQVLNLLLDLQEEYGLTYLVISHDLNVIRYVSDKIAVMYLGKIVEYGPAEEVFLHPKHPYTVGLMAAVPIMNPRLRGTKVPLLGGETGSLIDATPGCSLVSRCMHVTEACRKISPELIEISKGHLAACHLYNEK
ncbi:MAG: transporter ATP-binding protein [Brevibacillus sp.]|nr:transporter ATP-binding protein [Brevibacillus sp.]